MTPWTLTAIERALRASWAADTCSPDDLARAPWSPGNPAWGHCDITALLVNDLLGGDLVCGEVRLGTSVPARVEHRRAAPGTPSPGADPASLGGIPAAARAGGRQARRAARPCGDQLHTVNNSFTSTR
ncbi:YunG family protein [Streptantibioticus cattleyicolor]